MTSLDVIHSFWAYQLGVKADANPGVDNVAYTTAKQMGGFTVRCNELCGIWHGAMYDYGKVVPRPRSNPGRPACRPRSGGRAAGGPAPVLR